MTPYESFSTMKKGSSNLTQLALVTLLLLHYLYILSYHTLNLTSFEMPEILTETQLKRNILNIERKIARYIHHKEFLQNYKGNQKYPKVLALKFNLSFCTESPDLQKKHVEIFYVTHYSNYAITSSVVLS